MKRKYKLLKSLLLFCSLLVTSLFIHAQDSTRNDLLVNIGYHNDNNSAAYIILHAKSKIKGKFLPVGGTSFQVYLDKDSAGYEIGKLVTNNKGEAIAYLSPKLQGQWNSNAQHNFLAIFDGDKTYNAVKSEAGITKSRLQIDTAEGRKITVKIEELKGDSWIPAKDVEIKVAIKRLGGDLPVSDKDTYTTDSTGIVEVEFALDSIPGDKMGNITLIAKVEDNETYGNLKLEKLVHWGTIVKPENNFNERSLWATRFKAPLWLVFIAYSILISTWSVIIYLLFQLRRIKKAASL